jgi:hypothetical protein
MSLTQLVPLLCVTAAAVAAALWFAWRARTVAGFAAGLAAAAVVGLDDTVTVVVTCLLAAVVVGAAFTLRTVGALDDGGTPAPAAGRLGAAWLVLAFPAAVTWAALIGAHWMLHRG